MAEKVYTNSSISLYNLSIARIVDLMRTQDFPYYKELLDLPTTVMFDVYHKINKVSNLSRCFIELEWSSLKVFSKLLAVTSRRVDLLRSFEEFIREDVRIDEKLTESYIEACDLIGDNLKQNSMIMFGLTLGRFLSDAGCYSSSEQVLLKCQTLCLLNNSTPKDWCRTLECCQRLMHTQAMYCLFTSAMKTYLLGVKMSEQMKTAKFEYNYAAFYAECSLIHYMIYKCDVAYAWSIQALRELKPTLSAHVIVDILRQAAKSCIAKQKFQKAGLLIKQAVQLARHVFGTKHPVYANALLDYGLYLLKTDNVFHSVQIYQEAIDLMTLSPKLHIALAKVDFAYAMYTYKYESGDLEKAKCLVVSALDILNKLLGENHFLLANAKKVYALIFEELAIINYTLKQRDIRLYQAEDIHLTALKLIREELGENHVYTARQYGNLGRLYQTLGQFEKAVKMHLKCIRIKQESLGPEHEEVALSVGHLASLYNFDMHRYEDAEKLYHRCIANNLKLFGESCSGLEYDYRGLVHLYTQKKEFEKATAYKTLLKKWQILRAKQVQSDDPLIEYSKYPDSIEKVIDQFFAM